MAGKDTIVIVNQERVGEAKLPDAVGDLPDLLSRVSARIARTKPQTLKVEIFNLKIMHGSNPFVCSLTSRLANRVIATHCTRFAPDQVNIAIQAVENAGESRLPELREKLPDPEIGIP